jgi:hypothetical protein
LLAVQDEIPALRVEPPETVRVGRDLQNIAGIPAGHDSIVNCGLLIADCRQQPASGRNLKFEI